MSKLVSFYHLHSPSTLLPLQSAGVREPISYEDLDVAFGNAPTASSRVTSSDDRVASKPKPIVVTAARSTPPSAAVKATGVADSRVNTKGKPANHFWSWSVGVST